jgi:hypothetical protein
MWRAIAAVWLGEDCRFGSPFRARKYVKIISAVTRKINDTMKMKIEPKIFKKGGGKGGGLNSDPPQAKSTKDEQRPAQTNSKAPIVAPEKRGRRF